MPEPGYYDRKSNNPAAGREGGGGRSKGLFSGKKKQRQKPYNLPGEYAEFRLENGRYAGEVLGPEFFGPKNRRATEEERDELGEGNFPLARIFPREPGQSALPDGSAFSGNPRFSRGPAAPRRAPADGDAAAPAAPRSIPGGDSEAGFANLSFGPEDEDTAAAPAFPVARPRPARIGSRPPGGGPAVAGTAFTPDDIVDPWEREEFENLAVATQDGEGRKAGLVRDYLRDEWFFKSNRMNEEEIIAARKGYRDRIAGENKAIERNQDRMAQIHAEALLDATTLPPREATGPESEEAVVSSGADELGSAGATDVKRGDWSDDKRKQFSEPVRTGRQFINTADIIGWANARDEELARRRGERTDLLETPRQQEQDEAAPPSGKPGITDMTGEQWRAHQARTDEPLSEFVESFSRNYRKFQKKPDSGEFLDNPEGYILGAAGDTAAEYLELIPEIPGQHKVLVRSLREYGVDPGDPDAVTKALHDGEFRALLKKGRSDYAADQRANTGSSTEASNIMMDIYSLGEIDGGKARPDQLMPPNLAEQQRGLPPGNETPLEHYAAASDEEKAAMKPEIQKELVARLAAVLEKQGKVRGWDISGSAPAAGQPIDPDDPFHVTLAGYDIDPSDYRAVAELALTPEFARKWKINHEKYTLNKVGEMATDQILKTLPSIVKDKIKPLQ